VPLDATATTSGPNAYPGAMPTATAEPGYLTALLKSVVGVKGSHSILRDLLALRDLNSRIAQVGAIAELQMTQVMTAIDKAWDAATSQATGTATATGKPLPETAWSIDDPDDVRRLSDSLYASAPQLTGAGFATYCRLKVEVAGQRLADEIAGRFVYPPGSSRSSFVRAAIGAWARGRRLVDALD